VANIDDPAAALMFKDTTFFNNSHTGSTHCYPDAGVSGAWVNCFSLKVSSSSSSKALS
jgi:hypothetical protein